MNDDVVIRAEGLGKKYVIGHETEREHYVALRDVIARTARNAWRKTADMARGRAIITGDTTEDFWALRDVNFEVKRGEVLGIIGRNGAGKSTLLKILSRITEPSEGRVTIKGRVASLLEVGTGFHPELTGRENVYLNGAILGMRRAEIKRKFDEIVAFAEVEKFLDTPVKRYSSGMYVRLAFAVAAHLEPEILVVDEVLAVGDAAFQEKCIGKMNTVAREEGRTVLFVSHNMSVIQHLCSRAVLFQVGALVDSGAPHDVVSKYLSDVRYGGNISIADWSDRITSGEARITRFEIGDRETGTVAFGAPLIFRIYATLNVPQVNPIFGLIVHDDAGSPISNLQSIHCGLQLGRVCGDIVIEGRIDACPFYPGRYLLSPWVRDATYKRDLDFPRMCAQLHVVDRPGPFGDMKLDPLWGKCFAPSRWSRHEQPTSADIA
jgi:lipopolysaccharide transport system ATP-binding protein